MKRKLYIILIIILTISLVGIGYYLYANPKGNNNDLRQAKYTIKYYDRGIPENSYDIYIYDNIDVKVVKHPGCSFKECFDGTYKPKDEEHEVKFNDDIKNTIKNEYISKIFITSNNITVAAFDQTLTDELNKFIYAVINKDNSKL